MMLLVICINTSAQTRKAVYRPCLLLDSVEKRLDYIRMNASRVFTDTADCKQTLLDTIARRYISTKENKYLDALAGIRQNPNAKVEELYTDIIKRFVEDDFTGFIGKIYQAGGKYLPLEKELIATLNMIVDSRPLKQKYMGLLNVEIGKAKDTKDKYRQYYLEKLKLRIEEEKY